MATPASNANVVEEAIPMASNDLKMSAKTKMYDINGDGVLDETEKAMYDMDKSGKGFISNDKVYELMKGHIETQKELFRFKKVVIAMTAFIVILALANLGTSFAAAYLAKDTSTNKNDQLVNTDTDQAVSTQTTADTFEVTSVDEAERRRLCSLVKGNMESYLQCKGTSYLRIYSPKYNLIEYCSVGRTVKMLRTWYNFSQTEKVICSPSVSGTYSSDRLTVLFDNGIILHKQSATNAFYEIDGDAFTQDAGMICDFSEDCDEGLTCTSNVCA